MKLGSPRRYLFAILILMLFSSFSLVSCIGSQGTPASAFYNAGASDLIMTGPQFSQYLLFRFDTDASERTLTSPSAADMVAQLGSPVAGGVFIIAVVADGSHTVTVSGGTNVTVKPSASTVAANSTLTIFCELDNVSKGNESVTLY